MLTHHSTLHPSSKQLVLSLAVFLGLSLAPGAPAAATAPPEHAAPPEPAPEEAEHLTLREAMTRARSNAREVAAAEARHRASAAQLEQARSHRLPAVRLEEVWLYTDSPADVFGLQLSQEEFSFQDFVSGDPNDPDFLDNALTRVEVSLPLYTGGEVATRIRQAELGVDAASHQVAWTADEAALGAAVAYIRLAQARERVGLLERSLETVVAHADRARAYEEQGMLVASERLRAEVEVARLEDELAHARGRARVAEAALSFRLSAPLGVSATTAGASRWELEPLQPPEPLVGELVTWLAGVRNRSDLEAARQQVAAARLEARAAQAARRPRIGLAIREDFYDSWPGGTGGESTSVILRGTLDLFAGGRHKAARIQAEAEAAAAALELEHFLEGATLEVRDAFESARTARERFHTAGQALDAAAENLRISEARFDKGVVAMVDLLDAATALREAETRELVARAEAHLAEIELRHRAGISP